MKKLIIFLICLSSIRPALAQNNNFNIGQLESEVKSGIQKAYAASVQIANVDSANRKVGGYFSGVVVDTQGHILTAAHAVTPNALYLVTFPDGREFKAKGLGVIHSIDAAMIVITQKGKWPFAKMGWSSILEPSMPCISIAYPGSLITVTKPTVRLGEVAELKHETGFMRSTCLMEPGDSGGPLFDLKGRVIGIHSRISLSIDVNLEVPVDHFRKYWTALKTPAVHAAFIPEDKFNIDKKVDQVKPIPEMEQLISSFDPSVSALKNVFTVKDSSFNISILATLVNLTGIATESDLKGKSFFISKSSMVGPNPKVELADGNMVAAQVLSRDDENDLVLLQIPQEIAGGINLSKVQADYAFDKLGSILISPKPHVAGEISVLGNVKVRVPKSAASYLGVGVNYRTDDRVIVVTALYPLATEKKKIGATDIAAMDVLKKINNRLVLTIDDIPDELSKYKTNDTVTLQYAKKSANLYTQSFILKPRSIKTGSQEDKFMDGKSVRRDNFKEVLVHDAKLKPSECGGPLFDTKGSFYGVNIARLSRTSCLTIPTPVIVEFVKGISLFKSKER